MGLWVVQPTRRRSHATAVTSHTATVTQTLGPAAVSQATDVTPTLSVSRSTCHTSSLTSVTSCPTQPRSVRPSATLLKQHKTSQIERKLIVCHRLLWMSYINSYTYCRGHSSRKQLINSLHGFPDSGSLTYLTGSRFATFEMNIFQTAKIYCMRTCM